MGPSVVVLPEPMIDDDPRRVATKSEGNPSSARHRITHAVLNLAATARLLWVPLRACQPCGPFLEYRLIITTSMLQ